MKKYNNRKKWLCVFAMFMGVLYAFCFGNISIIEEKSDFKNVHAEQEVAVSIEGRQKKRLMPVGAAVGIHIQTNGLMVLGVAEIRDEYGEMMKPADDILKTGDYILKVNGQKVEDTDQMEEILNECQGDCVQLLIERDGKTYERSMSPVKIREGIYKIGVWLRDDTQGIGTLSFVDENNHFAALGHGIADLDTGDIVSIKQGALYPVNIYTVVKGQEGIPGEIVGQIAYSSGVCFGKVTDNNYQGIYGKLSKGNIFDYDESKSLPMGIKSEVEIGPASMRCQISNQVKDFDIMITGIDYNSHHQNRDFIIEVTDEELLEQTGGIIQGMSGSPIIQNGQLIGVVTHVFVNEPTKGYGIFIEEMLGE